MGVLKVWDGTDWRKVGCGGASGGGIWDDFDRADSSTSLGTSGSGDAWTAVNGTWGITSGAAYQVTSTTQAIAVVDTGLADCSLEVDVDSGISGGGGLSWRVVDNSDHWFWDIDNSGSGGSEGGSVYKRVGGSLTQVRTGLPSANHHRMGVNLSGSTIELLIDGVVIDTITDSTHASATKHGLRDYSGFVTLDNFSVNGAGPVVPGRLRLWTGTGWVREACDDDDISSFSVTTLAPGIRHFTLVEWDAGMGQWHFTWAKDYQDGYNTSLAWSFDGVVSGTSHNYSFLSFGQYIGGTEDDPPEWLKIGRDDGSGIYEEMWSRVLRRPLKIEDPDNPGTWITVARMVPV